VALNYQFGNRSVFANQGFFSQSGGCGYVLKPSWMLAPPPIKTYDVVKKGVLPPGVAPVRLRVTVLSGHYLPKPREYRSEGDVIDPFVEIHVVGVPGDVALHTTSVIDNNGFNPRWAKAERKATVDLTISRPDVAVLLFVVRDKNVSSSPIVAQAGAPVKCLNSGFRSVALFDPLSVPVPAAKLCVNIHRI
jgi:hypothetical protein